MPLRGWREFRWVVIGVVGICGGWNGVASPGGNIALNAGFEEPGPAPDEYLPAEWGFYTTSETAVSTVSNVCRSGARSLKVTSQGVCDAHMGLVQELPVTPGKTYTFTAYVMNDRMERLDGTFEGSLGIEWVDGHGNEIARDDSPAWDEGLSRLRWTVVSVTAEAPPSATRAKFVLRALEKEEPRGGACYIDDVSIVER